MKREVIVAGLQAHPAKDVGVYVNYLQALAAEFKDGKAVVWWLHDNSVTDAQLTEIFNKVATDGLYIDGDTVTLSVKAGKLTPDYSFQAYRKRLFMLHPETKIDAQCVYKGDKFNFAKTHEGIIYTHEFSNPFTHTDADLIGAYCIVKNSAGYFIEILSEEDARKMEAAAKTKNVWREWKSRMYLKSVIKRICKTFFHDEFSNIELLDNNNSDPENIGASEAALEKARAKEKFNELAAVARAEYAKYKREDKASIKEAWTKLTTEGVQSIETLLPIANRLTYGNLLTEYEGPMKNEIKTQFKSGIEITEEMVNNLKQLVNG